MYISPGTDRQFQCRICRNFSDKLMKIIEESGYDLKQVLVLMKSGCIGSTYIFAYIYFFEGEVCF
jgi:hypothetical protein